VEHAAGFLADVRDNWDDLSASDQEQAADLAGALLDEIAGQLHDAGYDAERFYAAFDQSGGDLTATLAVMNALGPVPRDIYGATDQMTCAWREHRDAERW
jgi:hypothetical protein